MTASESMEPIALGMSNLDSEIDDGFAEALMSDEGKVYGNHTAWDFCGDVYFLNGSFHEEVYRYHVLRETITAPNLKGLMEAVCDKFGYE